MDGATLSSLIDERKSILAQLLEMSGRQIEAITAGRMTELMTLLAEKQPPLQRLGDISKRLRQASGDDPSARSWESSQARENCRIAQEQCEKMHFELLAIEAQCETALTESREAVQVKLSQLDSAHQAANRYASNEVSVNNGASASGARLDLSSD